MLGALVAGVAVLSPSVAELRDGVDGRVTYLIIQFLETI